MRIFLKICPLCLQTAPKCDKMVLGYQNDHDLNTPNAATERVGRRTAAKREASLAERASARAQAEVRSRAAGLNLAVGPDGAPRYGVLSAARLAKEPGGNRVVPRSCERLELRPFCRAFQEAGAGDGAFFAVR